MRHICNIVVLLYATLICSYSIAQTTSVTFQVIDTDGQAWNNGTWTVQLGTAGQQPPQFVLAGTTTIVPNQQQSGNLDNTGNGAVTLTSNPAISPANSQWTFVFCPQATPANCQQQSYTISGASQILTVTPPGLRISATNPLVRIVAYFDGEIIGGNLGSQYFNLTDRSIHVCSTFTSTCVWTVVGTVGGGGSGITGLTTGVVPQAGSSTTIVNSNPQLDNGVTTSNTLTYVGSGGFALPSDGVHAGSSQWIGNTTLPSLAANVFGFIGPNSASFTSYFFQPSTTPPTNGQVLTAGTPAGSPPVIPLTYTTLPSTGITGSGTNGFLSKWNGTTALTDSPIRDQGGQLTSTEELFIAAPSEVLNLVGSPASCSGVAGNTFLSLPTCRAQFSKVNSTADSIGVNAALYNVGDVAPGVTLASTPAIAGVWGAGRLQGNGSPNFLTGVAGLGSTAGTSGTVANLTGVSGIGATGGLNPTSTQTATVMAGVDGQVQNQTTATTTPFGAALYGRSPAFTSPISHIYGVYLADQTAGGGTNNPDPHGFYEVGNAPNAFQGHLNQIAGGNWAGTCAMSAGTSCTITLSAAYAGTPGCVVTVQSSTVITGGCTVSGTTVTITAASSNSSTWAAMLFGNPN